MKTLLLRLDCLQALCKFLAWLFSLPIPCSNSFCAWLCSLPIPCSSSLFSSYSLLKLLLWQCSLPIHCSSSFCGCVPFLFPAQAPSVAVFPSYSLLKLLLCPSYSLLKLLLWLCSLPIPCSSSFCGCVPFLFPAQAPSALPSPCSAVIHYTGIY